MKRSLLIKTGETFKLNRVICLFCAIVCISVFTACGTASVSETGAGETSAIELSKEEELGNSDTDSMPRYIGEMELKYAKQFQVSYYEDGYAYIRIGENEEYVLIPENQEDIDLGHEDAVLIHKPLDSIYLAATAAMDLFREIDGLEYIKACSTKAEDYSIEEAKKKIESGDICFVGKYSAPDYEKLLLLNAGLAIESTMIYHSPKVREELEKFDIPVLVERSSYEAEPLGRLEWVKLYGLLLDKEEAANDFFNSQIEKVNKVINEVTEDVSVKDRPKVVFFYISSNGYVNVRKPGDYISKMIEISGGEYALNSLLIEEENALSTVNISWEDFYVYARDADILIYNGTIDGGINRVDDLIQKNDTINDFKAVKEGKVYCTNNNMFQETSAMGDIIVDLHYLIAGEMMDSEYIKHVE